MIDFAKMLNNNHTIQEIDLTIGITPIKNMTLDLIDSETSKKMGYDIHTLYNYNDHNKACKIKLLNENSDIVLDEFMWEEIVEYTEESRKFIFDTCTEYGVNECESYFLSLKFVYSSIRKFRNKLCKEFVNRSDFDRAPIKIALNHLIHVRLTNIMAPTDYRFSKEASDGRLGEFRKNAAFESADYLSKTGAIFLAKLTL